MNITISKFNHRSAGQSNTFTLLTTMEVNFQFYLPIVELLTIDRYANLWIIKFCLNWQTTLTSEGRWIKIEVTEYISRHFKDRDVTNISLVITASQANKNMASTLVTDLKKDKNSSFVSIKYFYFGEGAEECKIRKSWFKFLVSFFSIFQKTDELKKEKGKS